MHLPGPLRAAVGLVASAADEARHLPDRAIELPMLAVSTALQASLRAQQRYARLAARGDQVLNRRPATDEPPAWATFDDPVTGGELRRDASNGFRGPDADAGRLLDELFGVSDPAANLRAGGPAEVTDLDEVRQAAGKSVPAPAAKQTASKAAPVKKAVAKKAAAKTATAKKTASAAKAVPAKKTAAKKAAAKTAGPASRGKTVNQPRHTAPSAFDAAGDDD